MQTENTASVSTPIFPTPFSLQAVAEFHSTFGHPILLTPKIPDQSRSDLRVKLLKEEVQEFADAIAAGDIVEASDALADIQYVLVGAVLEFGLGEKFKAIFDEVQRSNMSKACDTEEEAVLTCEKYGESGKMVAYKKIGQKFVIYDVESNKVLKSMNYSPANIKPILDEQ